MRSSGRTETKRTTAIAIALLALAGSALIGTDARAEDDCSVYAQEAVNQQKSNEEKKCGFSGDGWSKNKDEHRAWCEAHPDEWQNALAARNAQLGSCGG